VKALPNVLVVGLALWHFNLDLQAQVPFAPAVSYAVGSGPTSVAAADVNGDGKVDLISANYNTNSLTVLTNNGSGGFATSGIYSVGHQPACVIAADVSHSARLQSARTRWNSAFGETSERRWESVSNCAQPQEKPMRTKTKQDRNVALIRA
jgi:hypothetical protein